MTSKSLNRIEMMMIEQNFFVSDERPEPPDDCRFNKTGVSGTIENRDIPLELTNYSVTQNVPIDCMWNITVAAGYKVSIVCQFFFGKTKMKI